MGAKSISRVDAAVLQEAVDREPFQQIEAIASRSQSPTSATKSANSVHDSPSEASASGLSRRALISSRQYGPTGHPAISFSSALHLKSNYRVQQETAAFKQTLQ
jgi:hypothetical protein